MHYIHITNENIEKEHICCAMSAKQSLAKKEWMRQRFSEGLVFYRSEERGKCFIEYIPAENAWVPIDAEGYLYINCLWIAGAMKGHGYANDLLSECIQDAKAQKRGASAFCVPRGGSGNFSRTRSFWRIRASGKPTAPPAGSLFYICPLFRMPSLRSSRSAQDIRKPTETALSFIIPTNARLPSIGCRGCSRWRKNTVSRSRSFISQTKKPHKTHRPPSRPMPCFETDGF